MPKKRKCAGFCNWFVDGRYLRCSDCGTRSLSAIPVNWPHPFQAVGQIASLQVGDGKPDESFVEVAGLKSLGPITIEGIWDDGGLVCAGCGVRFFVALDQPYATLSIGDVPLGPACDKCAMACLDTPTEPTT